jgi:hypothetical protein
MELPVTGMLVVAEGEGGGRPRLALSSPWSYHVELGREG